MTSTPIIQCYALGTLNHLKRAADLFAGLEKQGVHAIAQSNDDIVDVEITLDAKNIDTSRKQPRIDIAALELRSDAVELVFWEAKLFANKEIRANGSSQPKVVSQIKEYKQVLEVQRTAVLDSYRRVAKNLVAIADMSGSAHAVGPAIRAVAGGAELSMNSPAKVGLVIFGFDADQKAADSIGRRHLKKLEDQLGENAVLARGVADGVRL